MKLSYHTGFPCHVLLLPPPSFDFSLASLLEIKQFPEMYTWISPWECIGNLRASVRFSWAPEHREQHEPEPGDTSVHRSQKASGGASQSGSHQQGWPPAGTHQEDWKGRAAGSCSGLQNPAHYPTFAKYINQWSERHDRSSQAMWKCNSNPIRGGHSKLD